MLLIDAYNVLHLPEAQRLGQGLGLEGLCDLIRTSRFGGQRVLLVCDGVPPAGLGRGAAPGDARGGPSTRRRAGGVELIFSGPDRSADDELEDRLRAGGGAGVTVVSDDRRVRRAASRAKATSLGSGAFLSRLVADRERAGRRALPSFARDIPLDRYSTAHWMREFGLSAPDPGGIRDRAGRDVGGGVRWAGRKDEERGVQSAPAPTPRPEPPPPQLPDERVLRLDELAADPLIREALEAWKGRLRLEDLDMQHWLGREMPRRESQ